MTYPAQPPAQPAAQPPASAPPATAQPPAQPAAAPVQPPAPATPPALNDLGFPTGMPVEQMTADQQAAFWKHQSRSWEGRYKALPPDLNDQLAKAAEYDRLKAATQTDHERAIEAARAEGRALALRENAGRLVEAHFAAVLPHLSEQERGDLLAGLDRNYFLGADGNVDAAKIGQFAGRLAPAPANTPQPPGAPAGALPPRVDTGQGNAGAPARPTGLAAGAEIARKRHGLPAGGTTTT